MPSQHPPSDESTIERCSSLVNDAMYAVGLQYRRLHGTEPEDEKFIFRWWWDIQFLVIALYRLRRAAKICYSAYGVQLALQHAVKQFDESLPDLKQMRDIGEHMDEYAVDKQTRHNLSVNRRMLQSGSWDGTTFHWLTGSLNVDGALAAAIDLHKAVMNAKRAFFGKSEQLPDT